MTDRKRKPPIVAGFLYHSEADPYRNETVCAIVDRAEYDQGFGIEPSFLVRFADGEERIALAQVLTPWYPT